MKIGLDAVKAVVRDLKPYSLRPDRTSVKINQNENPWDAPARIKQETLRRMADKQWSRYPDFVPLRLQEKLAEFAGWTSEGIIAGNGSNELIQALLMVTVGEGKRGLICEPTFALYRQLTAILGGRILSAPLTRELTFDVDAILDAIRMFSPQVTIICSPNNPTGCLLSNDDLQRVLTASRGLVIVDEAYHEFARQTAIPLLRNHENLVVMRTFSKAMALAGLRVGYLLAAPELTTEIRKAVLPYNLNAFSQTAAAVAVEMYADELQPLVDKIIEERNGLFASLSQIRGLTPISSQANFMLVKSEMNPGTVFEELLRRDILIRDVSGYPMLREYFRVSVGTPAENDKLVIALREICERVNG
jgi:histidinol-phosphate aminotransferase